jgi:dTDP-4-dehydrorhamnose reductase
MRVLVLGAAGMMGHMACRVLGATHEVHGTIRGTWREDAPLSGFLPEERAHGGVDACRLETVESVVAAVAPDAVLNCIGVVKQRAEADDAIASITINALLPHQLAALCDGAGARLVHLSTDCVFSGRAGRYSEDDLPDPVDLYGRTKLLGEPAGSEAAVTLRTSIVGRELDHWTSFFEWVLSSRGTRIRGFDSAIYTGLTTMALARVIDQLLTDHGTLTGVWHVASQPISKYELIVDLDRRLGLGLQIDRDEEFRCDRSLDGSRFAARTGIAVPSWPEMLEEFVGDQHVYEQVPG